MAPEACAEFDGRTMVTADSAQTGIHLDEHHVPETNGRMSVCRRCGAQTDGPVGSTTVRRSSRRSAPMNG